MKDTKIEWCDMTFNPWEGCAKVSPGCANCYAEARNRRFGGGNWGPGAPRRRTGESNWRSPMNWNAAASDLREKFRQCPACGYRGFFDHGCPNDDCAGFHVGEVVRPRVFCASLADWLDPEVPIEWLADLLDLIRRTPHLDWLLLTKRPGNWRARIMDAEVLTDNRELREWLGLWRLSREPGGPQPPTNVWIGTSVEDQQRADERIPALLRIPARVRFLSCEPLLGPVDLRRWTEEGLECSGCSWAGSEGQSPGEKNYPDTHPEDSEFECPDCGEPCGHTPIFELLGGRDGVHWVVCGGESGPKARPMHPDWARALRDECRASEVPFFFKQWGEWCPADAGNVDEARSDHFLERDGTDSTEWTIDRHSNGTAHMVLIVKKRSGRLLDGREWSEFPEVAR